MSFFVRNYVQAVYVSVSLKNPFPNQTSRINQSVVNGRCQQCERYAVDSSMTVNGSCVCDAIDHDQPSGHASIPTGQVVAGRLIHWRNISDWINRTTIIVVRNRGLARLAALS